GRVVLIRLLARGLTGSLTHIVVIVFWNRAQINVHAGEVAALTRNVQRRACLGVDSGLGAPIWEISFYHDVCNTPCVVCLVTGHLAADGLTHCGVCTIATDNVLGVNDALVAIGVLDRDGNWVFTLVFYFEANERPTEVRSNARRALLGKASEVIQNACLVNNQVWEFRNAEFIIQRAGAANDVVWVFWILVPERHLDDLIGFIGDLGREAKSLERLHGTGLDSVCLAQFQTVWAALNDAGVDIREHRQLCSGNHARWTRAYNEHIHLVWKLCFSVYAVALSGQYAWIFRYIAIVVKLHVALLQR